MMTVIIFVLTALVMVRQGVLLARRRAAARAAGSRPRRGALRVADQERLRRDHDRRLRRASCASPPRPPSAPSRSIRTTSSGRNLLDLWADGDRERLAAFLAEVAATHGRVVGPIEAVVETGDRRSTLECVGSNLTDDPAIAGLALNFRDVSERKALEEQLRKLAFHDPLTLLANRSLFWNRVEHALALAQRSQQRVAVMFLDLDNFKNVNDSLGHDAGDRLLQAAAQRLVKSTRPSDTVARLGGDEFAILLEGIGNETDVERIAMPISDGVQPAAAGRRPGDRRVRQHRRGLLAARRRRRAAAAQRRHRHVQRQGRRQGAPRRVPAAHAGAAARPAAAGAGHRPRAGTRRVLPGVPAGRRPDAAASCWASRRWCAGITRSAASSCPAPSSRSPRSRAASSSSAAGCCVDACTQVRAWSAAVAAGDGPARGRQHLRPPPAAGQPRRGRALRARGLRPRTGQPGDRADREHASCRTPRSTWSGSAS